MNSIFPIIGLWLSLILGVTGYLARKKPYGKFFQTMAIVTVSLSALLFFWWAATRALALLPS